MQFIKNQNWRYATKKFNPNKKVAPENIKRLKQALQLSVSSYGLQPYKVLIIENNELKAKLKSKSWNQSQVTEASHLFVLCNYTATKPHDIEQYINLIATTKHINKSELQGYEDFMKAKLSEKSKEEQNHWSKCQTYIALANLLAACAELKIDACPMEGFQAEEYNSILGLTKKGLNASVIATIGYRHEEDTTQHAPKVRKPFHQLFEEL